MRAQIDNYELSDREIDVLKRALEYYVRGCQGQFSELAHQFWLMMHGRIPEGKLTRIKQLLDEAQIELHGSTGLSYRVGSNLVNRSAVVAHRMGLLLDGEHEQAEESLRLLGVNSLDQDQLGGQQDVGPH